jgi:hypothetical protein
VHWRLEFTGIFHAGDEVSAKIKWLTVRYQRDRDDGDPRQTAPGKTKAGNSASQTCTNH